MCIKRREFKGQMFPGNFVIISYFHYTLCSLCLYLWIQMILDETLFQDSSHKRGEMRWVVGLLIDGSVQKNNSRTLIDCSSFGLSAESRMYQRPPTKMFLVTAAIFADKPKAKINKNTLLCQPPSLHCKYCWSMQGSWSTYPLLSLPHPN